MTFDGTLKCTHCDLSFSGTMFDVAARHMAHLREAHGDGLVPVMLRPHETVLQKREIAQMLTDDQLRAECERRSIAAGYADQLVADRDEWKRRAEVAEQYNREINAKRHDLERRARAAEDERDKWKAWDGHPARCRKCTRDRQEPGPGISGTKPDNSIAHLDEDLLCEDA